VRVVRHVGVLCWETPEIPYPAALDLTAALISPTHKRTEGRAPVWGSEFTSKDAAIQGGVSRNRC
jgi:hypothetical protein